MHPLPSLSSSRAGPGSSLSEASSFSARTVVDSDGQVLGSVVDLMLDLDRGCVAYAVVGTGGFMGIGERLFAVPWSALRTDGEQLALQGKRSEFEEAPSFDREHWPHTPGPSWHQRLHDHFHSRPYWE